MIIQYLQEKDKEMEMHWTSHSCLEFRRNSFVALSSASSRSWSLLPSFHPILVVDLKMTEEMKMAFES
jgi:hypothetical protein